MIKMYGTNFIDFAPTRDKDEKRMYGTAKNYREKKVGNRNNP
ncbi:hypothetical protein MF628_08555 [Paenibacillus polymyxa]|nr:hypothetical protein [Paenibacillus polymyxa]WDZ63368.1 hypothetical protein MF628_08555 [Paenibacillus polymyxa]